MEIDVNDLLKVLQELYPVQLGHAVSETRARQAEARLAALEAEAEEVESVND